MTKTPAAPAAHRDGDKTFPEVQRAEWSDTPGTVSLGWGRWTMQAALAR